MKDVNSALTRVYYWSAETADDVRTEVARFREARSREREAVAVQQALDFVVLDFGLPMEGWSTFAYPPPRRRSPARRSCTSRMTRPSLKTIK